MIRRGHAYLGGAAFLLIAPAVLPEFYATLLAYVGLYAMVAAGLVLLTGVAGVTSFGQAAFVGIGAYTTAYLSTAYALSPWWTLALGLAITAGVALLLGIVTFRLSGHYLALGTLCWGMALYFFIGNLEAFGGHTGITGVPPVHVGALALDTTRSYCYLIWTIAFATLWSVDNLLDSRMGRAMRALKSGELMAESFGVNTWNVKIRIFIAAALFASVSGWLYAHYLRFISPTPFGIYASIEYLFMTVLGGASYVWGTVIGATVLTLLKQWLQDILPRVLGRAGHFEIVVLGLLLVLIMHRAREGIAPLLARAFAPRRVAVESGMQSVPRRAQPVSGGQVLEVSGLTRRFGGLVAVHDVGFSIRAGELVGLIGPNGAGKTTTFNLVSGALAPDQGSIRLLGQEIARASARRIASLGMARTFQHAHLLPAMSVVENAAIAAHLRGSAGMLRSALRLERAEERRLLAAAARELDRVGLGHRLHDRAGDLSLGEQKLLEVARALVADPVLLLLDEPAAGLRHLEKQALADLLRRLRTEGVTTMLVEHDMGFVMRLVDRLIVMNFGEKLAEGSPQEIQADREVRHAYLGVKRDPAQAVAT